MKIKTKSGQKAPVGKNKKNQTPKQTQAEKRAVVLEVMWTKAEASAIEFFHDPQRKAYATVPVADHRETWRVRSRDFKLWVMQTLYEKLGTAPKILVADIVEIFETHAICKGKELDVHVRIAERDGAVYVDLVNDRWQVLEITPTGWRVLNESPVKFRRAMGMAPLPYPTPGGNFQDIGRFLNIGPKSEILLLSWLTYSLLPNHAYPIVALAGVQGAGKSTITRALRSLIDPSLAALITAPRSERDLAIAASNTHMIAMDNLSEISPELSDSMCRVATGGSFRTRELYTNDDEMIFTYRRPLIINGIEELPIRPDLLDRSVLIHVEPITEERRRDEQTFWRDFESVRPQLLGRMLDIICTGLRQLPEVKLASSPRMADFARWGVAVEQALGFDAGSFMAAYQSNREDATVVAIEASPIAEALPGFLESQDGARFQGPALKLLDDLRSFLETRAVFEIRPELRMLLKHPRFPKSANAMSGEIARVEPNLKKLGITIQRGRTHAGRYIILQRTDLRADASKHIVTHIDTPQVVTTAAA